MGKAGLVGQKIAATFASTGTRAHFLHPAEAHHGDLGRIGAEDVVLAISHSGETTELIQLLPAVRSLGVPLFVITSRSDSTLARAADVLVAYGPVEEACPIGLAPSTSCTVMMAIGDAIAFVLMRHRDFEKEDFQRFHPSGSLGRLLERVRDVMRTGTGIRTAPSHLPVRDALLAVHRPGRRTGAVCLVDDKGRLDGVFTDSDLVKLLERSEFMALSKPIAEVMTKNPITASPSWFVQDALTLFRTYQVSEIPVIDEMGRPVGILDITDMVDLLPEAAA
jgi:arabinose-5-phosphate isomerase